METSGIEQMDVTTSGEASAPLPIRQPNSGPYKKQAFPMISKRPEHLRMNLWWNNAFINANAKRKQILEGDVWGSCKIKMRKWQSQRVSVITWNAFDGGKNKHGFLKKSINGAKNKPTKNSNKIVLWNPQTHQLTGSYPRNISAFVRILMLMAANWQY